MDRAAETAIKAILLGLHRSKAINASQLETVIAELSFAAGNLAEKDADAAGDLETLTSWLRDATAKKGDATPRLSRF